MPHFNEYSYHYVTMFYTTYVWDIYIYVHVYQEFYIA
jgi:hypothetical protein